MSRCFPFPPPGYVWKVGGESLVQLLKLRREGALACKKKMKHQRSSRKVKEKASDERKRFNLGKRERVKVDGERSDMSKERRCEATTWWSEIRCLSEELERLSSSNRFTSYRDYNQNITCKFFNNGSDECNSEMNLPEIKSTNDLLQMDQFSGHQMPCSTSKSCGSICQDTGLIPSNELCYSSSERVVSSQQQRDDCAVSSQFSQSSCIWESQAERWVPPPTPKIEYGDLDDLNWLLKTSSHGKSNLNEIQAMSDDHIHAPADKFPLYPSTRYLPEAGKIRRCFRYRNTFCAFSYAPSPTKWIWRWLVV